MPRLALLLGLTLLPLAAGCSVAKRAEQLQRSIEWQMADLDERKAIDEENLRRALVQSGKARLTTINRELDRTQDAASVDEASRRLKHYLEVSSELDAALAKRSTLRNDLRAAAERLGKSAKPSAGATGTASPSQGTDADRAAIDCMQQEVAMQTYAANITPELLLASLQADNEKLEATLAQHGLVDPAIATARHAALEGRVKSLIATAKDQLTKANQAQKKPLSDAIAKLETAAPRLRNGDGSAYTNPAAMLSIEHTADDAEEEMQEAAGAVEFRPSPWFRMHTGFATLAPYVVRKADQTDDPAGASFVLDRADSAPAFYVETDFLHRRAWLLDGQLAEPTTEGLLGGLEFLAPSEHEIRLRFTASDSIKDSKAAASGDWAAEASVGWSIIDYQVRDEAMRNRATDPHGSLNFELNGGFNTDRGTVDVHGFVQAGLGSSWAFPIEVSKGVYSPATFFGGVYYGIHEFPKLDFNDAQYTNKSRAEWNQLGALGVKVDVVYPLTETVEFVVGGRLAARFQGDSPEDWSLFVGVSLPIGKLFGSTTGQESK